MKQRIKHKKGTTRTAAQSKSLKTVLCGRNEGYRASLQTHKIYIALPDTLANKHGLTRVVDESGDDYLYPSTFFRHIALSPSARIAVLAAPQFLANQYRGIVADRQQTVRVTRKGQVTIPKRIRDHLGIRPGSEVDFVLTKNGCTVLRPVKPAEKTRLRSNRFERMRGTATGGMTTEEIMALLRG